MSEYDQFKIDNPHLERVYNSVPGLISGRISPMRKAGKEWENHLERIKKGSGKGNTINT